jgi:RsiW-degrading membrane proteinase PrsW (M82 family)
MMIYASLGLCAIGAALVVYRYDLYDREPLPLIGLAIALGAGAMALAGRVEGFTIERLGLERPVALAGVAAVEEEGLKLLSVAILAALARRAFNDPMDGIIYGSMVGLGAALEEGVAVLGSGARRGGRLPPEEIVRLCGHLVMGGIGGFGVGRVRLRQAGAGAALTLGLATALSLHFGWDLLALGNDVLHAGATRDSLLGAALMLSGLLLYGRLVAVASAWSQKEFSPGRVRTLAFWPFEKTRDRESG